MSGSLTRGGGGGGGGGTTDDGGDGGGIGWSALPPRVRDVITTLSASVAGYTLSESPIAFVEAVILTGIVDWGLSVAGNIAGILDSLWLLLAGIVVDSGSAAASPFTALGEWALDVLVGLQIVISNVAASFGPLAPLVVIAVWMIMVLAAAQTFGLILGVAKWLT